MRRALASMVTEALRARRPSSLRALEFRFWGPVISQAEEIASSSLFALHAGGLATIAAPATGASGRSGSQRRKTHGNQEAV
jgi:hypothetical protein